jgi:hypothetical protein
MMKTRRKIARIFRKTRLHSVFNAGIYRRFTAASAVSFDKQRKLVVDVNYSLNVTRL